MPTERANKKQGPRSRSGGVALKDEAIRRSPGRPTTGDAKRDNPEFKLTSVFLPKTAYANAQAILIKSNAAKGEKLTVSDILSEYLTQWVKKQ